MNEQRIAYKTTYKKDKNGTYILYWMQQAQRIEYNHALIYAIESANQSKLPLCVYFGLTDDFPDANLRHYQFMLQGLLEVATDLKKRGIGFFLIHDSPEQGIAYFLKDACEVVMDQGYLRIQKKWYDKVITQAQVQKKCVVQIQSDVVVPLQIVSDKMEYAARTIRPKIKKNMDDFLETCEVPKILIKYSENLYANIIKKQKVPRIELSTLDDISNILSQMKLDQTVFPSHVFYGGERQAKVRFEDFILHKLEHYLESNSPANDYCSGLSPYLHFGQISSVWIAREVYKQIQMNPQITKPAEAFLEQLIIRRELAMNYVFYNSYYDQFEYITDQWAYKTMEETLCDTREYIYSLEELEFGQTHDPYWNAAMYEMVQTGYMHNYMRMYWGKKIYEWSKTPKQAFEHTLYLNNKYFLDGRDANSYAGIAWCYGKHDRAWTNREIFGKLRYMNQKGLLRKFDMEKYLKKDKCLLGEYEQTNENFLF